MVRLWHVYNGGMRLHSQSCKLYFHTCTSLFVVLLASPHSIVNEVQIVEVFLENHIGVVEVGIEDFCDIVQLNTNTAQLLCLQSSGGICYVLYIGRHLLL